LETLTLKILRKAVFLEKKCFKLAKNYEPFNEKIEFTRIGFIDFAAKFFRKPVKKAV